MIPMELIQVWIEHPVRQLDRTFTYAWEKPLAQGVRVQVDFHHKKLIGFVESSEHTELSAQAVAEKLGFSVSRIQKVLDEEPLITPELHDLAMYMRDTTLAAAIACFQAMLPAKVKPQTSRAKVVEEKWIRLSDQEVSLTPRELEAYALLQQKGPMRYRELRAQFPNQAHSLVRKGAAELFAKEKEAASLAGHGEPRPYPLTPLQQQALREIQNSSDAVYLLYGVTGSGKTEIYLELAAEALHQGRQVLFLVPEISLTPQMIQRVRTRFGEDLAVYHSGLNPQEKYEQYRKVMTGRAGIVVGTRSAVFLPFSNLGLIVMDEEHDSSYKQENQPAYHCRDMALFRGKYHHCKVILGSATPSLESFARARKGVYHLVNLKERIHQEMPKVTVISLTEAMKQGQSYILTDVLKEKMAQRLTAHQQVILLLNRRGYSSLLRCRACKEVIQCPHCDLAMSWHRSEHLLKCHSCGTVMPLPRVCPACGSTAGFASFGYGTERLAEEVQACFPQARILRMDADTTAYKDSHARILNAFGRHEADILLGTQMIAKGLDYPDVTLVGILNGDEGLRRNDYRSCETTFDLLVQAAGRSGRNQEAGEVVYQVFDPDHYAVRAAARQDYELFYRYEMQFRHAGMYPPYTYMIALNITSRDPRAADTAALALKENLHGNFKVIGIINLLKIQDWYRDRILVKGQDLDGMRGAVREALKQDYGSKVTIRVNVNPMTLD